MLSKSVSVAATSNPTKSVQLISKRTCESLEVKYGQCILRGFLWTASKINKEISIIIEGKRIIYCACARYVVCTCQNLKILYIWKTFSELFLVKCTEKQLKVKLSIFISLVYAKFNNEIAWIHDNKQVLHVTRIIISIKEKYDKSERDENM